MSVVKFHWSDDLPPELWAAVEHCWLAGGYDGAPVHARRKLEVNKLSLTRDENESSFLQLPWPTPEGSRVVSTATLRPKPDSYSLLIELARGTINRLRNLLAELEEGRIPLHPEHQQRTALYTTEFGRHLLGSPPTDHRAVKQLIDDVGALTESVINAFTLYRLDIRKAAPGGLPLWYGARVHRVMTLEESEAYLQAFNAIRIYPNWAGIEPQEATFNWSQLDPLIRWASEANLGISVGPLIDLTGPFPGWLEAWHGDLPSLTAFMSDFMGTVISRYREHVKVWQVFSGFNHMDLFGLSEDDRVRLADRLLEEAKQLDPEAIWLIGVSQPWGDYLTSDAYTYSPLVFADTLLRAGHKLGGVELEMLMGPGHGRRASWRRDSLDTLQLIELFDHLGLPVEVRLSDPAAFAASENLPPAFQAAASSPTLQALYWDRWTAPEGEEPADALWHQGPTPQLAAFRKFRQDWLR